MGNMVFVVVLAALTAGLLTLAFRALPKEKWQIFAAIPLSKGGDGHWSGVNLTWYGILNANAYAASVGLLFVLLGAVGVAVKSIFLMAAAVMLICIPSSRIIAKAVEKRPYTFTVGGASFVGMIISPWVILLINALTGDFESFRLPLFPALSALAVSYAFGEGWGRLACISFGCCYGKRLSDYPPFIRRLFQRRSFVFWGKTKKIAYASGMEGEPVLPVQAITSALYLSTSLIAISLYLHSFFIPAFVLSIVVTQGWRAFSETLRADYRGEGKISAYQVMSIGGAIYSIAAALLFIAAPEVFPSSMSTFRSPEIMAGLNSIWNPGMLLFLQLFWAAMFLFTGRSMVTGAILSFHVHKNRI